VQSVAVRAASPCLHAQKGAQHRHLLARVARELLAMQLVLTLVVPGMRDEIRAARDLLASLPVGVVLLLLLLLLLLLVATSEVRYLPQSFVQDLRPRSRRASAVVAAL